MIRQLFLLLVSVGHLCSVPAASAKEANTTVTVVYWGSNDCRWCTYWESSVSGLEAEFRASSIFPGVRYIAVKNAWLKDSYVENDFPSNQRWLWKLAEGSAFRLPRIRPTWSVFVGDRHIRSYVGTKAWKDSALPAIQRLVVLRDQSPERFAQALPEVAPANSGRRVAVTDLDAVPYLDNQGKEAYRIWLGRSAPKAFAVSLDGAWGHAKSPDEAMRYCQRYAEDLCELYAVDTEIVWHNSPINQ